MAHGPISISTFIEEIIKGDYVIPHFQRDFDWQPNMVSDLFKSILHDYYAGTILLWNLEDEERKLKMWDPLWGSEKNKKPTKAVLDGQQRLSSLFYALCSPQKKFPKKESYYYFFIDIDKLFLGDMDDTIKYTYYGKYKDNEHFKIKEKKWCIEKGLFPLCLLSDKQFMNGKGYEEWIKDYVKSRKDNEDIEVTDFQVSRKIDSILKYTFLTENLEKKDIREICTIFANINSKGLKLDIFDLMNAFLYPKNIQLRKDWENLDNDLLKQVDTQMKVYILKLISLYKQNYCSSKYLYNLIPGAKIKDRQGNERVLIKNTETFKKLWETSLIYSEKARKKIMNNGMKDFGAIKHSFIPNTTIIPVLGALMYHYDLKLKKSISEEEFWKKINKWYWCAVISQDYSGSSDSIMARDYKEMVEWFNDDDNKPERIRKINSVFIEELNLDKIKNTNNSQYCTILSILSIKSAKDFFTGRTIGTYPINEINDHHIFPIKSGLKIQEDKIDSILNRTPLLQETNIKIKNKKPSKYVKEIARKLKDETALEKLMKTHLISPKALKCLRQDDFDGFIKERNISIKKELKKTIGIFEEEKNSSLIAPGKDYDNRVNYISYIEDCEEFINIIDPYFKENSIKLLREGLRNNKSIKSIKIITKPDALEDNFKDIFKKFSKQMKNENISVEIKVLIEPKIKSQLHDRYLITKNKAYNFVSADTVSRGQLSHIKEVSDISPIFDEFWMHGEELIESWNKILKTRKAN